MIKPSGVSVQELNSLNVSQCSLRWADLRFGFLIWNAQSEVENSTQRSTIIQATTQGVEEEEINEQAMTN